MKFLPPLVLLTHRFEFFRGRLLGRVRPFFYFCQTHHPCRSWLASESGVSGTTPSLASQRLQVSLLYIRYWS